jgi:hypothetical protein
MEILIAALVTFVGLFAGVPFFLALARLAGLYAIVEERTCRVYMLFGRVVKTLDEPGLHILPLEMGPSAFVVNLFGQCHVLDMRIDQEYRRSEPVNSEEGAPMGIGIWYEMWISDPIAYLFKNTDPRGSLRANVSNVTVHSSKQYAAGRNAGDAPHHEPDGAGGSIGPIAGVGLSTRIRLHPQGPFPTPA